MESLNCSAFWLNPLYCGSNINTAKLNVKKNPIK